MATKVKPERAAASRLISKKGKKLSATGAELDPKTAEDVQDAEDVASVQAKLADQSAKNKLAVVDILADKEWIVSQSLTQAFGQKAIAHFKGDVEAMPKWRFTRRYLGSEVILVDMFRKQKEYDAADVEARRALVHKLGGRYAAAGPGHSRLPHSDPDLRKKYPSISEQLEAR